MSAISGSFEPTGFALDIFRKRYAFHENESWAEASRRVAVHVSAAETPERQSVQTNLFQEIIQRNLFMPGGRIWYGSGRSKGQLLNCFVIPTSDSREGWGKTISDMVVITGTGGGLGVNCSPIRPRGSAINGSGGHATGAVSLMEIINAAGEVIKAGGGRRTALMLALNLNHGDIEEFLDKKLDLDKLNNANVSVIFNDNPEDFFAKVKDDASLDLLFRGRVVGKVQARLLWKRIISNALRGGEPGLLNMYFANRMSNVSYLYPLICSNPCGEINLPAGGSCCLGALVLPRFVKVDKEIDWDLLRSTIQQSVRFLDDVLTVNNYPLPEIKEINAGERRIGLGIMGLHDMLLLMGLKYNTPAGLEKVDLVLSKIKNWAYEASIELAREKGPFPKFDPEPFLKSGFAKTLRPSIRSAIREHGIRNCALLTIAPTGTTSIVSMVTSGIEPMFAPAYERRFRDGDDLKKEIVVHPLLKQFVDARRGIAHFQGAFDLKIRDHFEMQRTCQRHVDNAVSKTINLPQGMSEDELSELYMEFFPELKGVTVYPDGSRADQPLTPLSLDEAVKHIHEAKLETEEGKCRSGVCDL